MATVVRDPPREDQPFAMLPSPRHLYNAAQQTPIGVYPNVDGPYPSMRQPRSQRFNTQGSIATTAYSSPIYDHQSSQLVPTDHHPIMSSQQPPAQQPSPPQSFKDPPPTHIKQSSDEKAPEFIDTDPRSPNSEDPTPLRQPSLYNPWQPAKTYGQDPPPSRGSMRSLSQQQGLQLSGITGGQPSQQPSENPPVPTSPSTLVPVTSNPRVVPLSPRYVNAPLNGTQNPTYTRPHNPREEVCLECAMRDQDMADVDVTTPGIWERDSDVYYQDLVRSEEEAISSAIPLPEDRPRSTGDMLTETNLKLWLSMNPREPASRHMNLETYVRSQRLLLEAETLAHARAMQESKELENKMRDTYSHIRRSVHEFGALHSNPGAVTLDETGRIRSATLPGSRQRAHSHSRDVTLLENGLIVEHVNVKKEEKEERERRKREERRERNRVRKSSRGSGQDITSVYGSLHPSQLPPSTSGGAPVEHTLRASRYSQSSLRPTSILSSSMGEKSPTLPRAYSTTSFSDLHSINGSTSPNRKTRFLGNIRALSPGGWRSRDSLAVSGISGSMVDMHVALQQEDMNEKAYLQNRASMLAGPPPSTSSFRTSVALPQHGNTDHKKATHPTSEDKRKKKKGLAKIWSIVTGSSPRPKSEHNHSKSADFKATGGNQVYVMPDDDYPLAPPPPLSYLVERDGGGNRSRRHSSTPCLPGTTGQPSNQSPQQGYNGAPTSPPTAPSSVLPSPVSLRMPPATHDAPVFVTTGYSDQENDLQQQLMLDRNFMPPSKSGISSSRSTSPLPQRPHTVFLGRDKNLPPLPPNETPSIGFLPVPDISGASRPQTMYASLEGPRHVAPPMATVTENLSGISEDSNVFCPPQIAFRGDGRRQSFEGMERPRVIGPNSYDNPRAPRQNGSYPHMNANGGAFNAYHTYHGNGQGVGADAYGEFGSSRTSLGWLEDAQRSQRPPSQTRSHIGRMSSVETTGTGAKSKTPSKRKSRFGLANMFGKKKDDLSGGEDAEGDSVMYSMPSSEVHQLPNGEGRNPAVRMSVASRKAIQQLVEQDPEFVAYRYPSNDILQHR